MKSAHSHWPQENWNLSEKRSEMSVWNFHYEEREQVWSRIRNCRNEECEILSARMELLGSRRNKETITEKEAFVFISRKEFQRSPVMRF